MNANKGGKSAGARQNNYVEVCWDCMKIYFGGVKWIPEREYMQGTCPECGEFIETAEVGGGTALIWVTASILSTSDNS